MRIMHRQRRRQRRSKPVPGWPSDIPFSNTKILSPSCPMRSNAAAAGLPFLPPRHWQYVHAAHSLPRSALPSVAAHLLDSLDCLRCRPVNRTPFGAEAADALRQTPTPAQYLSATPTKLPPPPTAAPPSAPPDFSLPPPPSYPAATSVSPQALKSSAGAAPLQQYQAPAAATAPSRPFGASARADPPASSGGANSDDEAEDGAFALYCCAFRLYDRNSRARRRVGSGPMPACDS